MPFTTDFVVDNWDALAVVDKNLEEVVDNPVEIVLDSVGTLQDTGR